MGLIDTIKEWLTPRAARSWPLDNAIQAQAFSGILAEESIPHKVRRNGEALFAYPEQAQEGWGRLETDEAYFDQVDQLHRDFLASEAGEPEETEAPEKS
jgi:hypothetical protein